MSAGCTMRDVVRTGVTVLIAAVAAALATVAGAATRAAGAAPRPTPRRRASGADARGATTAIVLRDQTALRAAPRDSAPQQARAVAGRGARGARRAPRLPPGLGPRARARRLRPRQPGAPQPRSARPMRRRCSRWSTSCASRPAARRSASASPPPICKAAPGRGLVAAAPASPPSMRSAPSPTAWRSASRPATRRTRRPRPRSRRTSRSPRRYGVHFASFERDGRMQICYDGDAFRRVLARVAEPQQQARAVLALTRPECVDPALGARERAALDEWRVAVLDRVDTARLPAYLKNRVAMRRAGLWSAIAFRRARLGGAIDTEATAAGAAERALDELAAIDKGELTDDDQAGFDDAAIRVNASRWAADSRSRAAPRRGVGVVARDDAGRAGPDLRPAGRREARRERAARPPLHLRHRLDRVGDARTARATRSRSRCSRWRRGASCGSFARRATAGASTSCRRRRPLPASASPSSPAGCRAGSRCWSRAKRAARAGASAASSWSASTASVTARQSSDPDSLGAFQRWQDPAWKRATVSLR